eukprot:TRINITY_DN558_c0_g1_i2.p1 TRINITY_DN558_c0_g1~~TRINITY_DN558_c0_g1_i2.p1  ORF type:complete len:525 (+),score=101.69 TRINITY_DN558_c0_g1_i2:77-1576(+)
MEEPRLPVPAASRAQNEEDESIPLLDSPQCSAAGSPEGEGDVHRKGPLIAMLSNSFTSFTAVSLLAPLLPQHLQQGGLSPALAPIVFLVHPVGMLLSSVPVNALIGHWGRPLVFRLGVLVQAFSLFWFAFAPWLSGDNQLLQLAHLLGGRAAQGVGAKMAQVAALSAVADEDHGDRTALANAMAWNEIVIGGGFALGPVLGGVLYQYGGFWLPFFSAGAAQLLLCILLPCDAVPAHATQDAVPLPRTPGLRAAAGRMARVLHDRPEPAAAMTMAGLQTGYFALVDSGAWAVHAAHAPLRLNPTSIGFAISSSAVGYNIMGLLCARLIARLHPLWLMFAGSLGVALFMAFFGPLAPVTAAAIADGLDVELRSAQICVEVVALSLCAACGAWVLIPALPAMGVGGGEAGKRRSAAETEAVVSMFDLSQNAGTIAGPVLGVVASLGDAGSEYLAIVLGVVAGIVAINTAVQYARTAEILEGRQPLRTYSFVSRSSSYVAPMD